VSVRQQSSADRQVVESAHASEQSKSEVLMLAGALGAMDLVVLSRESEGSFRLLSESADWFQALTKKELKADSSVRLEGVSDYLDNFLVDARAFWARARIGRLRSGPWEETAVRGNTSSFEAQALVRNGTAFLVIERLSEAYEQQVKLLQVARNHLLNEEVLEREVLRRTAATRQREEEIAIRLLAAASMRDAETGSHVRRIGLFSAAIGAALGWHPSRSADIKIAAPMHDIGKIGIPDGILLKPGRLTDDEYHSMQQHTVIGARMLGGTDIPLLNMGCEIALCHHEKWDGSGYPNGLRGEDIPIAARIVAIVDVFDAMLHRRVYKAPIPELEVLDTMAEAAGKHFDPRLFEVFRSILPAIREICGTVED
jgi:response regulator RpfG family c-di-GMP phosphodiesterase